MAPIEKVSNQPSDQNAEHDEPGHVHGPGCSHHHHHHKQVPFVRTSAKIGRNDPCPCESGKKYKKCCLLKES